MFLGFFEARGHAVLPSAPLVPANDPSVLFTTAGMHPLAPYLLGEPHPAGRRLASVQKCMRTGDIDEVGDDAHLTCFEMLGNWSLGEYGREESIGWSFEFLTSVLGLPLERLAATCFAGDSGAPPDEASLAVWRRLGMPAGRIARLGREDNWWGPAGSTGPCGPDTEIFYWVGTDRAPEALDVRDRRWVEIWNNVFMSHAKTATGELVALPRMSVDTGMGVERALVALNGLGSVYEVDTVRPLYEALRAAASARDVDERGLRVVADHMRAACMAIADGVAPSNKDRGYVVRRLVRRCAVFARRMGLTADWYARAAEVVARMLGGAYPEVAAAQRGGAGDDRGRGREDGDGEGNDGRRGRGGDAGDERSRGREDGDGVCDDGRCGREDSGNSRGDAGDDRSGGASAIAAVIGDELGRFERTLAQGLRLAGMEPSRQHRAPRGSAGSDVATPSDEDVPGGGTPSGLPADGRAVLDGAVAFDLLQTYGFPFELTRELAEAAGKRVDEGGFRAALEAHRARSRPAGGAKFRGGLADHSTAIVQYHTATHLLQAALRAVLGEHVIQRGSNITHERLRFDFSHDDRLAPEDLARVERLVNGWLDRDLVVARAEMSEAQARALGAIGAFGEKYGAIVSVYSIADRTTGEVVSREFCGGPHVGVLGELGARRLQVVREQAVASGIRRIKAVLR